MKKFLVCLAVLVGLACTQTQAQARCNVRALRLQVRAQRIVVAPALVVNAHHNAAAIVVNKQLVVDQAIVVNHGYLVDPLRSYSRVQIVSAAPVVYGDGYATSALAEELRLERLARSGGDVDAKLARFKAELKAEIKDDVVAAVSLAVRQALQQK